MEEVTLKIIKSNEVALISMSYMTDEDIRKVWGDPNDGVDLVNLEYHWNIPLYQKMIFRFRHSSKSPFAFCNSCDPSNMERMPNYYGIYSNVKTLVYFFAWIKNQLCIIDFYDMFVTDKTWHMDKAKELPEYKFWLVNEIVFFFNLFKDQQVKLIDRYNKDCVETYNILYSD